MRHWLPKFEGESWFEDFGVKIQEYVTDNASCFSSKEYTQHLKEFRQIKRFADVGAHHSNALAERAIQTVMSMARTMMLHATIRWPEVADAQLWPMAVEYAVYIYNRLPQKDTGLSPLEVLTGTKWPVGKLHDLHVLFAPTYVLDPDMQDGKKIPR